MNKIKSIIMTTLFALFLFGFSAACYLKPADEYSTSERRYLAARPELSIETISSGDFMKSFEEYAADQFPLREKFRSIKARFSTSVLHRLDNNGLFMADGHISKIDDPENEYMMNYSAKLFQKIINTHMADKNVKLYFSIVPDKNFFLAEKNGYPSLDYNGFIERMRNKTEFMKYIDITSLLSIDDYYKTDTHWRQENIVDIAEHLAKEMGISIKEKYTINTLDNPFYGVYAGQLAMKTQPDTIKYLTNETLDNCVVSYYDTGLPVKGDMYDMKKAHGKAPYEMFLSGTAPLVTIENSSAQTNKELVIFRDSFGGSIAPLFAKGYKKITVVDVRYVLSDYLSSFINFQDCDVLFLYSTSLLNNSLSMK